MQKEIVNVKAAGKPFPRIIYIGSVDLAIVKPAARTFSVTISAKEAKNRLLTLCGVALIANWNGIVYQVGDTYFQNA